MLAERQPEASAVILLLTVWQIHIFELADIVREDSVSQVAGRLMSHRYPGCQQVPKAV